MPRIFLIMADMFKKRRAALITLCVILTVLFFTAALLLLFRESTPGGTLRVSVVDAYTLAPLGRAYVVCAETGNGERCKNGFALLSGVPASISFEGAEYGEATLIAYADGYKPSILLRAHVYPGKARTGPTMYMFPSGSDAEFSVTVFSEAPDEYLMEELAARFAP